MNVKNIKEPQVNRHNVEMEAELIAVKEQLELIEALANKYNQEIVNRDMAIVRLERKEKNMLTRINNLQAQLNAYKDKPIPGDEAEGTKLPVEKHASKPVQTSPIPPEATKSAKPKGDAK